MCVFPDRVHCSDAGFLHVLFMVENDVIPNVLSFYLQIQHFIKLINKEMYIMEYTSFISAKVQSLLLKSYADNACW